MGAISESYGGIKQPGMMPSATVAGRALTVAHLPPGGATERREFRPSSSVSVLTCRGDRWRWHLARAGGNKRMGVCDCRLQKTLIAFLRLI